MTLCIVGFRFGKDPFRMDIGYLPGHIAGFTPMNSRFAVCGVLMDPDPGEAEKILRYPGLDLVEWRLDHYLKRYGPDDTLRVLEILSQAGRHPVIATNRPVREGGLFEGS